MTSTSLKERAARAAVLALARRIRAGELAIGEPGLTHAAGPGTPPKARIDVLSPLAWPRFTRGVASSIDAYGDGLWDSPDLSTTFRVAARNVPAFDSLWRRITCGDLGHELFSLMLDSTMMYSCALFEGPQATLHEAQIFKLETVCEKLALGPDDHVLEVGGGWGGFAVYAAATRGCHVTTTTVSRQRHQVARERVRDAGLENLVDVRFAHYREIGGRYDKLVTIEMFEAVDPRDVGPFLARCSSLLAPHGTMLLQATNAPAVHRSSAAAHGLVPSQGAIAGAIARRTDLRTLHLEDFTPHYAETLRRWRANLDVAGEQLERLGYDARVRRLWGAYLAAWEADFEDRRLALVQMVLAKPHAPGKAEIDLCAGAPVDRREGGLEPAPPVVVDGRHPRHTSTEVGAEVGMAGAVLALRPVPGAVVQDGFESVVVGAGHVGALVDHHPGELLAPAGGQ